MHLNVCLILFTLGFGKVTKAFTCSGSGNFINSLDPCGPKYHICSATNELSTGICGEGEALNPHTFNCTATAEIHNCLTYDNCEASPYTSYKGSRTCFVAVDTKVQASIAHTYCGPAGRLAVVQTTEEYDQLKATLTNTYFVTLYHKPASNNLVDWWWQEPDGSQVAYDRGDIFGPSGVSRGWASNQPNTQDGKDYGVFKSAGFMNMGDSATNTGAQRHYMCEIAYLGLNASDPSKECGGFHKMEGHTIKAGKELRGYAGEEVYSYVLGSFAVVNNCGALCLKVLWNGFPDTYSLFNT